MYVINVHHRNGNIRKSQWTISEPEELSCFDNCQLKGWYEGPKGWGLHVVEEMPDWLGVAANATSQLFIAKFVADEQCMQWHGYPADYRRNHHDIPIDKVLRLWLVQSVLPRAKVRKIAKGQPCNL